jgi:hypothetical protein
MGYWLKLLPQQHICSDNAIQVQLPCSFSDFGAVGIANFPVLTDLTTLRGFLGLVNQLGHFLPDLAHLTVDLRQLLTKDVELCGYSHTRMRLNSFVKY